MHTGICTCGQPALTGSVLQLVAGEQIELTFGERLGLSTLAAAALGNLVSDVCGVGVASHIEVQLLLPAMAAAAGLKP